MTPLIEVKRLSAGEYLVRTDDGINRTTLGRAVRPETVVPFGSPSLPWCALDRDGALVSRHRTYRAAVAAVANLIETTTGGPS